MKLHELVRTGARTLTGSLSEWPGPDYVVTVTIRAPIEFVHRWCTDYSPKDSEIEGEEYTRRILRRSSRRVVYEDLVDSPKGWLWARYVVDLHPPDGWHMEGFGNASQIVADYTLTPLPHGRTRFLLRYRRKPSLLPFRKVAPRSRRKQDTRAWHRFARALEADYRTSLRRAK